MFDSLLSQFLQQFFRSLVQFFDLLLDINFGQFDRVGLRQENDARNTTPIWIQKKIESLNFLVKLTGRSVQPGCESNQFCTNVRCGLGRLSVFVVLGDECSILLIR
ncbi:hypothetical protein WJ73_19270 [Burkholderia ubonensis]|nr:hypothetical protein WJ73_19270 [Burkholderia ubonensis]